MLEKGGLAAADMSPEFRHFAPYLPQSDAVCVDPERYIIERLARSPVPPSILITFAKRVGFKGVSVLRRAALESAGPSLFSPAESGEEDEPHTVAKKTMPGVESAGDLESVFEILFDRLGERREQQLRMAREVGRTIREEGITLIEAGTGTGKSLAYLVPSAIFALEAGERVIVSTHTKNLQDQLYTREIELVREAMSAEIRAARLVGRENYICSKRLMLEVSRLINTGDGDPLELALCAAFSPAGTVDAVPPRSYQKSINAPARCRMNRCEHADSCPLVRARKEAARADIVFANHALVMADYSGGGKVLGDYHTVIFDEAHHLERCVMENLSVSVSPGDIRSVLEWISPIDPDSERWRFLIHELEREGPGKEWKKKVEQAASFSEGAESSWGQVFRSLNRDLNCSREIRSVKKRYYDGDETFADVRESIDSYIIYSKQLCDILDVLCKVELESGIQSFQQELEIAGTQLRELSEALDYLTGVPEDDVVYWLEWNSYGSISSICGSPLRVDRRFADFLSDSCRSSVLTSATISQNGSFDYITGSLGTGLTGKDVGGYIEPSSFINDRNCRIILRSDLQDPNLDSFAVEIASLVEELSGSYGRRMLVLFTSYRMCNLTAYELKERDLAGEVLVQGEGLSRDALSERFRVSRGAVLLGVASFWEGVDFPGTQLEILIIPKIPFPVPADPMVEARTEMIRKMGGNPFTGLFLPEAVLRLRQGIGRLIRGRDDRGVIVILDSRIQAKSYGKKIISSLPTVPVQVFSAREVLEESDSFFEPPGD
ncbi:MAG: hypothetical protein GF417_13195 [Candidatus Latescibacteria bacterium]|nr:hypothetical protein [bacterium]MBD3425383.1 hypothetical protein [Candidatus Latescibacterota bacterium]